MNYRAAAREFVHEGYCHLNVDAGRVSEANECFGRLFSGLIPNEELNGTRNGETEVDVGLIRKTKAKNGAGDDKWYFHVSTDMRIWLSPAVSRQLEEFRPELKSLLYFKRDMRDTLLYLTDEVEIELGLQTGTLSGAIRHSSHNQMRYSVNTLRGLFYQAQPGQTGATPHIDRDLITGHLGDEGGELEVLIGDDYVPVSPPPGKMLVFAGAKMLWLTNGVIAPLRHRSTVVAGKDRRAMVFFSQADIGYYPDGAQPIVDEFYRRHPELAKSGASP